MRLSGNLSSVKQPNYFLRHIVSSSSKVKPVVSVQKPHNDRPNLREYFDTEETTQNPNKSSSPYSEGHMSPQSMYVDIYA